MGRPKKSVFHKVVGFRIPEDKIETFKENVNKYKEKLLTVNSNFNGSEWTNEDIKYFMDFFQRNKEHLHLNPMDKDFFKDIARRFKHD